MNAPCVYGCGHDIDLNRERAIIFRTPPAAHESCFQASGESYEQAASRVQCCNSYSFLEALEGCLARQWTGKNGERLPERQIWLEVATQTVARYRRGPHGVEYLGIAEPKKKEPAEEASPA